MLTAFTSDGIKVYADEVNKEDGVKYTALNVAVN